MFRKLVVGITCLFFFSSGITWVVGNPGQGLSGRLTMAELFGFIIIVFYSCIFLGRRRYRVSVNPIFYSLAILIFSFFISAVFANFSIQKAFFELLVLVFIFFASLSLYNLWVISKITLEKILLLFVFSSSSLAVIGIIDFFGIYNIGSSSVGGLSGTFRNTGQAGTFFATSLAIIIPAILSKNIKMSFLNIILVAFIFLALFFTFKRAAYIGFFISLILIIFYFSLISKQKIKNTALVVMSAMFFSFLAFFLFNYSVANIEGALWRFESKLTTEGLSNFKDGFWFDNIKSGIDAFKISPIIGVGLGNVAGNISGKWEIHSTYLAILATGGILSFAAYLWFVFIWLKSIFNHRKNKYYGKFIILLFIMILGLFVSWIYTYHIRKREFWILITISSYVIFLSKNKALPK